MARNSKDKRNRSKDATTATRPDQVPGRGRRMRLAASMDDADDMSDAPSMKEAKPMPHAPDMDDAMEMAGSLARGGFSAPAVTATATGQPSINAIEVLALAQQHIGESYVFGTRVPIGNPNWKGPWDCAEFVSWCVYNASGILFGTEPADDPLRADAYTGYWAQQAAKLGCAVSVADAMAIPGAILLRKPQPGATGHIVISDGVGGTVEAHSSALGVIASTASGRRWDTGILVPGINYFRSDLETPTPDTPFVLRLTHPMMQGERVRRVQEALNKLGLPAGSEDGVYGPQTAHAVEIFQAQNGLVADGEFGPATEGKLFAGR